MVRDANGTLITTGTINLGISIHDSLTGVNTLYYETHNGIAPNAFGVVNVLIGGGSIISGNFLNINWATGPKFMQVYVNSSPIGGRVQMVSVPYSLYASNGNPPGTIVAFGGTTPPAGWLLCDGTSYNAAQYPALYAAILFNFGGQGANFNVPDLRGRFLRGVDGNANRDPDKASRTAMNTGGNVGNLVGSVQADTLGSHGHGINDPGHSHSLSAGNNTVNGPDARVQHADQTWSPIDNTGVSTTNISVQNTGGSETRPINANVNYIIKY
ncbi:MAG: phage tail protein [Bacteroidia bacterium]|nr:phage tail protein [Bacteroidia bacterium]